MNVGSSFERKTSASLQKWQDAQNKLQAEREAIFALIADPKDWKAEIEAFIPYAMNIAPEVVLDAIIHFTGAGGTITHGNHGYTVWAVGYRNGPAGP